MEMNNPAPAPAPGVTVDVAREAAGPTGASVLPMNSPAMQAVIAQKVQEELEKARTGGTTSKVVRGADLDMLFQNVIDPKALALANPEQKETIARILDLTGQHHAARQLRGKKDSFVQKTLSLGETTLKAKHVIGVIVGSIILIAAYEAVASKMEWSFRIGIWDQKSSRR
jgi:hypothetical protein